MMNEIVSKPPPVVVKFTQKFNRDLKALAKKYRAVREDFNSGVLEEIEKGNFLGEHVAEVSQKYLVHKTRCKNSDATRGKRGGYRVVYCIDFLEEYEDCAEVFLLTIYSKSDQGDISPREIAEIIEKCILAPASTSISSLS